MLLPPPFDVFAASTSIQQKLSLFVFSFIIAINLAIISLIIFRKNVRPVHKVFAGYLLSLITWMTTYFLAYTSDSWWSTQLSRLCTFGVMSLMIFTVWFAYMFPDEDKLRIARWKKVLLFLVPGFFIATMMTPWTFVYSGGGFLGIWQPGEAYRYYAYVMVIYGLIWPLFILVKKYRSTNDSDIRKQIVVLLTGFSFFNICIMVFVEILPLFLFSGPNPISWDISIFGPFSGLFLTAAIVYTMFEHRLFNAKVFTTQIFIFILWMALLVRVLVFPNASFFDIGLLCTVIVTGIMLMRSVKKEVDQKEALDTANVQLNDLNENLQKKVDEQTREVKQAYEIEKKAHEELKQLNDRKNQFILLAQHHLRTPLAIIHGYVKRIIYSKETNPNETVDTFFDDVKIIDTAADRLGTIVGDLIDITEGVKTGEIFAQNISEIERIIASAVLQLQEEIQKKKLIVAYNFSSHARNAKISVNLARIEKVFKLLLENAVQYSHDSGTVSVTVAIVSGNARFIIRDDGIGMSEYEISQIFSGAFSRGEEAEKINTRGTGLNMVLAKNSIESQKGRIWAESQGVGKGSAFFIEFPLVA